MINDDGPQTAHIRPAGAAQGAKPAQGCSNSYKAKTRLIRGVLGLSVQDLADLAHVSPRHIRRVEDPANCKERPHVRLMAFCDACSGAIGTEARRLVAEALRTDPPAVLPVYVSEAHLAAARGGGCTDRGGAPAVGLEGAGHRVANAAALAAAAVLTAQGVAVEVAYPPESRESREASAAAGSRTEVGALESRES